jgi:hypothetical protein
MAQVVIVNLQALVSHSDERRLIAAVAGDADVDEGVLLDGSLLLLLLLLLMLLDRGFRDCNCGLKNRRRVVEGKGQVGLALDLNSIILRAVRGDAETAVAGASNGDGLVREAELQADDQRVDVGGSDLHDANSFEEL